MRRPVLALAMLIALPAAAQAPERVAVTSLWSVDGAARSGHAKVEPYLGREALWVRAGTHVTRTGLRMADGVIAFDLAPMKEGDFAAVTFRRQSATNHENIYFRLQRSGEFMALQYAPRMNGSSTWQLYPEFTAATDWPREQWTRVRIEIAGSLLRIFAGDNPNPVLTVPRLRHDSADGEVAFWGRVNDRPNEWAAAFSNITITPAASAAARGDPLPPAAGLISTWEVAGPFAQAPEPGAPLSLPPSMVWTQTPAEESGLVNLNRRFTATPGQKMTAYAKFSLLTALPRRVALGVGYSDNVTVYVNGAPVYAGVNGWNSRYPAFVSFVDPNPETVTLPLKAGLNDVVLAVTDDQVFGWGFSAKLGVEPGIRVIQ